MPWTKDNLPDAVKSKDWTDSQIEAFVKQANAILKESGDEGVAIATAIKHVEEKSNAKQFPKFYYARHMLNGLCGYEDETILLSTDTIKDMMPSFNGKPVYVYHQNVDLDTMKQEAAGYVSETFYNELDGWCWSKIMIIDDEAHEVIARGWSVSNAYVPTASTNGGVHHNLPYDREITAAEYTHLAIVPDPRYEGAKIFTPDEFKAYQDAKKKQLDELKNSKPEEKKGIFMKFFKFKKEEVSQADADTFAEIKNAKGEIEHVKVQDMVDALLNAKKNEAEEKEEDEKENEDQEVTVGDEKMPLSELINRYQKMNASKKNEADDEDDKEEEKENQDDEDEDDKEEKSNSKKHFEELKNAHKKPMQNSKPTYKTWEERRELAKQKY